MTFSNKLFRLLRVVLASAMAFYSRVPGSIFGGSFGFLETTFSSIKWIATLGLSLESGIDVDRKN